jgi:predicted permease
MVRIDLRLAAMAGVLSLVAAVVAGVSPAWTASGVRINEVLKVGVSGSSPGERRSLRELLATTELAMATVLLIIAGLLIGSFVRLSRAHWGFNPDQVQLVTVVRPPGAAGTREVRTQWTEMARERLQRIAGVESVASADGVPIRYSWRPTQLTIQNRRVPMSAGTWMISHGYFATMRTPILEGREFHVTDDGSATPVVVVSRALAGRLWPGVSAVGKELQILYWRTVNGKLAPDIAERIKRRDYSLATDPNAFESEARLVIGVVEDMRPFGLHLVPDPALYLDYRQERAAFVSRARQTRFVVRTKAGAASIAAEVKSTLGGPGLTGEVRNIESMSDLVAQSIGGRGSNRLMMLVATLFGGLALVLTTIGIFGVMLHTVNQRLPEFGVRVALGANRADIARLVFGYGGRVLLFGLALGLTLTWAASRTLRSLLFELAPTDLSTWAGAVAIIVAAVLFACVFPLRRALGADAAALLRS